MKTVQHRPNRSSLREEGARRPSGSISFRNLLFSKQPSIRLCRAFRGTSNIYIYNIEFCATPSPSARSIILAVSFVSYACNVVARCFSNETLERRSTKFFAYFIYICIYFDFSFSLVSKLFLNIEKRNLHDSSLAFTYIFIYV